MITTFVGSFDGPIVFCLNLKAPLTTNHTTTRASLQAKGSTLINVRIGVHVFTQINFPIDLVG